MCFGGFALVRRLRLDVKLSALYRVEERITPRNANEQAVAAVLEKYQEALNTADTNAVISLYLDDGVFMQPYGPSVIGKDALRKAYDADFNTFRLNVKFNTAEVDEVGPGWVFARTNSSGTNTDNATGTKSAEANQELFIFKKDTDGQWKIARYSFSTTNPLRHA